MLACYYPQGTQLASGVIGLLTCQSHYNVSVIKTTPCARLLLRHHLDQRIPTHTCESYVNPAPATPPLFFTLNSHTSATAVSHLHTPSCTSFTISIDARHFLFCIIILSSPIYSLVDCSITEEGFSSLASALRSNPSHMRVLGLNGNKAGDSGVKNLSSLLEDPNCKLEELQRVSQDQILSCYQ